MKNIIVCIFVGAILSLDTWWDWYEHILAFGILYQIGNHLKNVVVAAIKARYSIHLMQMGSIHAKKIQS